MNVSERVALVCAPRTASESEPLDEIDTGRLLSRIKTSLLVELLGDGSTIAACPKHLISPCLALLHAWTRRVLAVKVL